MKRQEALEMRKAINTLFRLTQPDRYCVAIEDRFPELDNTADQYQLHLYLRIPKNADLVELAMLAREIEDMVTHFLTCESTYDAGTEKGEDIRNSVKIW